MSSSRISTGGKQRSYKFPKREFECVSPTSPEMAMSMSNLRKLFDEKLTPVTIDLNELKRSVLSQSNKMEEIMNLVTEVDLLKKKQAKLETKLAVSEKQCEELSERVISLETYTRRNNLKFLNVACKTTGSQIENCESLILDLCSAHEVQIEGYEIERAHRIGHKNLESRPIIVKFANSKSKDRVLRAKSTFKQAGIIVVQDFPAEVQSRRKLFSPVITAAFKSQEKYKAKLVVDKLLLNGKMYTINDLDKLPQDINPSNLTTISQDNITAFYTRFSKLSNHYSCTFTVKGVKFSSVEQYLMHSKAVMFGDASKASDIMDTPDPSAAKSLGRKVFGFKADVWKTALL